MFTWKGTPDRGAYAWPCAIAMLIVATLLVHDNVYAAQQKKAGAQDRTEALLKSGYVELSGDDAVRFLLGNSVVIKKADTPKGFEQPFNDETYYFSDPHTAYLCINDDCSTHSWKVHGNEICFELPERCDSADYKFLAAPRLFKAPRVDERTGKIGIYVEYESFLHAVIRGNTANAPLLDTNVSGKKIQLNAADFARDIEASSKFSGGDKKVRVQGSQAVSLLIGNTFMSGETATDDHGGIHLCPAQGFYYSPDGRIITFNCFHWPDSWEMGVSHWKMQSGRLCIEDVTERGSFGCGARFETVQLTPSDTRDVWLVIAEDIPREIFGYAGNVFNFK